MCLSSPRPTVTQTVTPPPAEAPQPLALPDGEALSVASLRLGGRNSLRTRANPANGLTIGGAAGAASTGPTGATSGGSAGGSGGSSAGGNSGSVTPGQKNQYVR